MLKAKRSRPEGDDNEPANKKQKLNPSFPNDSWNIIVQYCDAMTIAKSSQLSKHCYQVCNNDELWEKHVKKRWSFFYKQLVDGNNWKKHYIRKHNEEKDMKRLVFQIIERNGADCDQIENDIANQYLDVLPSLEIQFEQLCTKAFPVMQNMLKIKRGKEPDYHLVLACTARLLSHGQTIYDNFVADPTTYPKQLCDPYEDLCHVWTVHPYCRMYKVLASKKL